MDARQFDVFHDGGNERFFTVGDRVHFALGGVVQEAVDQHGIFRADLERFHGVALERGFVVDHFHTASAQHEGGTDHDRITDPCGDRHGFFQRAAGGAFRLGNVQRQHPAAEVFPVFGEADPFRLSAEDRDAVILEFLCNVQRSLTAELNDHAFGFFLGIDREDIFQCQRFKVELVTGVVVRGNRFRVAVDHDGLVALFAQSKGCMHAGVVELDPLTDTVRTAAEDHDLLVGGGVCGHFVRRAVVGGEVVARTVVHAADGHLAVGRDHAQLDAAFADHAFGHIEDLGKVFIGEAHAFGFFECFVGDGDEVFAQQFFFKIGNFLHFLDEVAGDLGHFADLVHTVTAHQRFVDHEETLAVGIEDLFPQHVIADCTCLLVLTRAGSADFQRADRFLIGFLEVFADGHDFTHRAHLGAQFIFGFRELFKCPAGKLDHYIISGGRVLFQRAIAPVGDLIQRNAGGELGGDVGNGETGRLGGEGGGTTGAGVDLDHHDLIRLAVEGKLAVAAAGDAGGIQDAVGVFLQAFLCGFGNGEHGGNAETVAGMHTHGVNIFDEADGDLLTLLVAHNFQFQFFPAEDALFHKHLTDERGGKSACHDFAQFFHIIDDPGTGTAHGVCGTEDHRVTQLGGDLFAFFHRFRRFRGGNRNADGCHGLLEFNTVFAALDRFQIDPDHLHVVFLEDPGFIQAGCHVQCRLSAKVREQGVRAFPGDDFFNTFRGQRFDVGVIRRAGVCHDRSGVGVHKDHFVTRLTQRFACLCAGIVKLTCLSNDDRSGADDQDFFDVGALRHKMSPVIKSCLRFCYHRSSNMPQILNFSSADFKIPA